MRYYVSCLSWFFTSIVCSPALAVYIDEAYHTDYHYALLGVPQQHTTFFHRPSANSKGSLLYSLSEKGVLGATNPKDGSIIWRQSLTDMESSEIHKGLLRAVVEGDTIFSAINGITQAWDAAEGRLVWEQLGAGESKDMVILDIDGRPKDILILNVMNATIGIVRRLDVDSGEILWQFKDNR
jgi:ER membrane protein complex subunit 1